MFVFAADGGGGLGWWDRLVLVLVSDGKIDATVHRRCSRFLVSDLL